jgi:beta-N-acetylhexosaminidase
MNSRLVIFFIVILLGLAAAVITIGLSDSDGPSSQDELGLRIYPVTPSPTRSGSPEENRANAAVREILEGLTVEEKIGQMLMFGFEGTRLDENLEQMLGEWRVGGLVLRDGNLDTPNQIRELSTSLQKLASASGLPAGLLLAVDQEGGAVTRLRWPFTQFPAPAVLGAIGDPALTRAMGETMAEEMMAVGINVDLAPVLDVNDNPLNPVIGPRSFGDDAEVVAVMGTAFLDGLHDGKVIATGKHFPGHGSTSTDSHIALPVVTKSADEIRSTELVPFEAAVEAGVDIIMTAHVAYPALDDSTSTPATLSEPILTEILRQELGFAGVILTDEISMAAITGSYSPGEAAVMAIAAGADMILSKGPSSTQAEIRQALLDAVRSGRISEQRLDESVARILQLKTRYHVGEEPQLDLDVVGCEEHARIAERIAGLGD